MNPSQLSSGILQAEVMRHGLLRVLTPPADRVYSPPKIEWLLTAYDAWFRQSLAAFKMLSYVEEAQDCDDFAAFYVTFAKICHRKMGLKTALPVGVLHYKSEELGPHAIVAAYTSDKGLVFIEPQQSGKLVNLSTKEKESAWLLHI